MKYNEQALISRCIALDSYEHLASEYEHLFLSPAKVFAAPARSVRKLNYLDATTAPKCYNQIYHFAADTQRVWRRAYESEIFSIESAGDLKVIDSTQAKTKLIPLREVFNIKVDNVTGKRKFKVRICARGDLANERGNFYSPVVGSSSLRLLLMLYGIGSNVFILQADVSTAFLHARDIIKRYYELPQGHPDRGKGKCWAGFCALYGLRGAPKCWYNCFKAYLADMGYYPLLSDPCIFARWTSTGRLRSILKLYVDDLIHYSGTEQDTQAFKTSLKQTFKIRSTRDLTEFIGVQLHFTPDTVHLFCQDKIEQLAQVFEISSSNSQTTPMVANIDLFETSSKLFTPVRLFQRLMGSLNWIAQWVRPDIQTAVHKLSQFQQCPRVSHFRLAKKIVRYLLNTKKFGLQFTKLDVKNLDITVYVDSGFNRIGDCKSTYGYCIYLGPNLYKSQTKRFKTVLTSTALAETHAFLAAIRELQSLTNILTELRIKINSVIFFCDNKAALDVLGDHKITEITKELKIKDLKVREVLLSKKNYYSKYIKSADNIADQFTKILDTSTFLKFRQQIVQDQLS